ncbi:hypothetical protein MMC28_004434 [Mycoblastus sanguinarius]|nr:hypothetical protein [Mycoblastus sanguinarius]
MRSIILTALVLPTLTLSHPPHFNTSTRLPPREINSWQYSGLAISTWDFTNCQGDPSVKNTNVQYDASTTPTGVIRSFTLSRPLLDGEQLDFSAGGSIVNPITRAKKRGDGVNINGGGPADCEAFVSSVTSEMSQGMNTGCQDVTGVPACFRLWHH